MTSLELITYMAASFIVLLGIALVILLISRKENRASALYRSVVIFATIVFAYCMLYFYFFFRDMIIANYAVGLPFRLLDYLLYGAIPFFWLRVIERLAEAEMTMHHISFWAWSLGIAHVLSGCIATCFMNEFYGFANNTFSTVFIIIESSLTILTVCVIGIYTFNFIRNATSSRRRIFVGFVSIIYCLYIVLYQIVNSYLYSGRFTSAWAAGIPDATAPAVFLMGFATFLFLFREDFSPLFYLDSETTSSTKTDYSETKSIKTVPSAADPLELSAAQHGLTLRELDVMRLVYEGKNNPEIAEELLISRNTVKKHLQSIYEKVGVNSRIELIYVINRKNYPPG